MTQMKKYSSKGAPYVISQGGRRITVRFRNINIAFFFVASVVMAAAMLCVLRDITRQISGDYARFYALNTSGVLSAYLNREVRLIAKTAGSQAIIEWFADEGDPEKKRRAHAEMMNVLSALDGNNLYFGIEKSLNEYSVEKIIPIDEFLPHGRLDPDYFDDEWYFEGTASDREYDLKVDIDKKLKRKLVWLNYKVVQDGVTLGLIATGLDFCKVAEAALAEYGETKVRGFIIDEKGHVMMDSSMVGQEDFLLYASKLPIEVVSPDPGFLAAVVAHIDGMEGYFDLRTEPTVIALSSGPYGFATIAPIGATNWAVVTLFKPSSLFNLTKLLPLLGITLALLIAVALVSGVLCYRFVFRPFEQLIRSLGRIEESVEEEGIYGIERSDEFGILSNIFNALLNEARRDVLTGLYNRRFMEKKLQNIIKSMSRCEGALSVLMIDVDFFKNYNDTYGHDKGDACLKSIAGTLLRNITRVDDFVARYGGEEFVAVLPNTGEQGAGVVAAKLLESVRNLNIAHKKSDIARYVTISIGGTTGKVAYTQSPDDYLKRADEAMYISKQSGRNRYTFLELAADRKKFNL
ncbi:MAG: GGDEF domain-containing protein [Planctomycetes bacterium]|nr:GGDEF domain-containing protein [Planctomycetota bacterium]